MIPLEGTAESVSDLFVRASATKLRKDFLPRLEKALAVIPEGEMWNASGEATNSPANLLLHMAGNLRQWVISGIGGTSDERNRPEEFSTRAGRTKADLLELIHATVDEACAVLDSVEKAELNRTRKVQAYTVTGLEAIYHAVEHFSYHLGQIIHIAKHLSGKDLTLYHL